MKWLYAGIVVLVIILIAAFALNGSSSTSDTTVTPTPTTESNFDDRSEGTIGTASPTATETTTSAPTATNVTVSFNGSSFSPSRVTVKVGQSVTFINNSSKQMWVASDPHPIHTKYGAFDANRGYAPGTSYTFTFDKAGAWGFHDHITSSATGVVTVE